MITDQLIKKSSQGGYREVFPKTFLDAIVDRESGKSLTDILNSFNMYFISYTGDREETRIQIPKVQRRKGIWLTYVLWDNTIVSEFYNGNSIEDDEFRQDSNWIEGSNRLIGDIMISSNGTWVINGIDSGLHAKGDTGITPLIRTIDNKLQVSYDRGDTWEILDNNSIITIFRVSNNKLEVSSDLGKSWTICSEYIASWFRWSNDNKIQISRDNVTWEDLSPAFTDGIYIKGYLNSIDDAPPDAPIGSIYMVGPTDGHYYMYIKTSDGWINNGSFTSFQAGIAQDLSSNSENMVPSVKAVNQYLSGLILTPITVSEFENLEDLEDNRLYLCIEDE